MAEEGSSVSYPARAEAAEMAVALGSARPSDLGLYRIDASS